MGLDMYLTGKKYVKDWDHNYSEGLVPATTPAKQIAAALCSPFPIKQVEVELMTWRKANAIHNWFVQHIQNGIDECQEAHVPIEDLEKLRAACRTVIDDPTQVGELLPPTSGFFFGSTDVDEWYWENIRETEAQLTAILAEPSMREYEIYYQSSW